MSADERSSGKEGAHVLWTGRVKQQPLLKHIEAICCELPVKLTKPIFSPSMTGVYKVSNYISNHVGRKNRVW